MTLSQRPGSKSVPSPCPPPPPTASSSPPGPGPSRKRSGPGARPRPGADSVAGAPRNVLALLAEPFYLVISERRSPSAGLAPSKSPPSWGFRPSASLPAALPPAPSGSGFTPRPFCSSRSILPRFPSPLSPSRFSLGFPPAFLLSFPFSPPSPSLSPLHPVPSRPAGFSPALSLLTCVCVCLSLFLLICVCLPLLPFLSIFLLSALPPIPLSFPSLHPLPSPTHPPLLLSPPAPCLLFSPDPALFPLWPLPPSQRTPLSSPGSLLSAAQPWASSLPTRIPRPPNPLGPHYCLLPSSPASPASRGLLPGPAGDRSPVSPSCPHSSASLAPCSDKREKTSYSPDWALSLPIQARGPHPPLCCLRTNCRNPGAGAQVARSHLDAAQGSAPALPGRTAGSRTFLNTRVRAAVRGPWLASAGLVRPPSGGLWGLCGFPTRRCAAPPPTPGWPGGGSINRRAGPRWPRCSAGRSSLLCPAAPLPAPPPCCLGQKPSGRRQTGLGRTAGPLGAQLSKGARRTGWAAGRGELSEPGTPNLNAVPSMDTYPGARRVPGTGYQR